MQVTVKRRLIRWIIMICIAALALAGCRAKDNSQALQPKTESYFMFDTIISIKVYDERMTEAHFADIREILQYIDATMSRTVESSEISQVNANAGIQAVSVSEETFALVQKALDYAEWSDGAFDPTVGPLVDLWGIGNEGAKVPDPDTLAATVDLIDYRNVEMDEASLTIRLKEAGMALDLGAIAKGYAGDRISEYLTDNGFDSAIIDLGGNIIAHGSKPGDVPWTIGVQSPDETRGEAIGHVKIRNQTVVSSGVYERFFIEDGVRYHHILSTEEGYPIDNGLESVTIITDQSADADALSTTVFALGLERGRTFIERLDNTEAVFITSKKEVFVTAGLQDRLVMTNDEYKLLGDS